MSKILNKTGYFDCRKYKKGTKRNEREMCAEGERINLSVGFAESELTDEVREFARLHEKSGKYFASFKVFPKNCKAYNASGKEVAFPPNEKLDGGQFEANLDFSVKHGTGTELNGLYLNKIQFIRKVDNAFEAVDGDDDMFNDAPTAKAVAVAKAEIAVEDNTSDVLPF